MESFSGKLAVVTGGSGMGREPIRLLAVHARDHVHVARQLSVLGSFAPLIIVALTSLNVISESAALAVGLAAALLAFDLLAWRVVAGMSDRERLVTGRRG